MDYKEYQRISEIGNTGLVQPFVDNEDFSVSKFNPNLVDDSKNQAREIEAQALGEKLNEKLKEQNRAEFGQSLTLVDAFDAAVNTEWVAASMMRKAMGADAVRSPPDPNFAPSKEILDSASHDMTPAQKEAFNKRAWFAHSEDELMQIRGKIFEYSKYEETLALQGRGTAMRFVAGMTDPVQLVLGAATGGAGFFGKGVKQAVGVIGTGVATNMAAESLLIDANPMRSADELDSVLYSSLGFIGGIYGIGKLAGFAQERAIQAVKRKQAAGDGPLNEHFQDVKPEDKASVVTQSTNGVEEMPIKVTEVNGRSVKAVNLKGEPIEVHLSELRPMSDEVRLYTGQLETEGQAWKPWYTISYGEGIPLAGSKNHPMLGMAEPAKIGMDTPWAPKYDISYGEANRIEGPQGVKALGNDNHHLLGNDAGPKGDAPSGPKLLGNDTPDAPAGPKLLGVDTPPKLGYEPQKAMGELLPNQPVEPPKTKTKRKPRNAVDIKDIQPEAPKAQKPEVAPKTDQPKVDPVVSKETPSEPIKGNVVVDSAGRTMAAGDSVGFWKSRNGEEQFFEGTITEIKDGIAKVLTTEGKNLMTKLDDISEHTPKVVEDAKAAAHQSKIQELLDERPHRNSMFDANDAPALRALGELEYGALSMADDLMQSCELGHQSEKAAKKKPRKTKK